MPSNDLAMSVVIPWLMYVGFLILGLIIFYVIVKAAVRNGTMEAHRLMEIDDDYEAPHGR